MAKRNLFIVLMIVFCTVAVGCSRSPLQKSEPADSDKVSSKETLVVGFSQVGAESDWRSENTESMKQTFTADNGYELLFEDGQQKQANQIMAVRTFIQRGVDYIVLAPVVEAGWDTVLQEAKDAGIPVIIVDRMVDVADEELYTAWVGSDFQLEGAKASEWINQYLQAKGIHNANIVNIQGTIGATAQIGRTQGLQEACRANSNMTLLAEVPGDFTLPKAKEVMESLLKQYDDINIVYCENDNEAFGVIEAVEAAGKRVGSDIEAGEIMVVSFDGVKKDAMHYVLEDKISCIAECNPMQGPRVQAVIEQLEAGKEPPKFSYVDEEIYVHDETVPSVFVENIEYPVTVVTQDVIDKRAY
ncbi:ABC transporter substrate-binding protein [Bariatricus massiliensis]|uniref:ABC transporter substrate-binding protein n=1 Tax=Bariatricus massiliensis TaxID=1745713 RepID=A0ABS8DEY6_9FIRM|nr:ABC transporter substrate-binding protein [Bariatricus massiliensis]MCB7303095.1 ABC transporter substrate-binding protein [Bariatricus massiliensis]MCB7374311.1 ABC transporter substrate-binding protein [Bariatricus massiliensis]MCB7386981.1 ABC transporter substrate-binding protein [Bariatricus massiliensis]MCB7411143.1 ABC transporter substrate-binding protein [Bariatricus massiliensis]MCQ5251969.1 ABC transporter substrate-binding protein [Bariatricus massiliensis]